MTVLALVAGLIAGGAIGLLAASALASGRREDECRRCAEIARKEQAARGRHTP
jgi:hypothetical protein